MVKVKLYGLLALKHNHIQVNEGKLSNIIKEICNENTNIEIKELKQSIIFVNKQQLKGIRRLNTQIKDNDELVFLSPTSGG